MCDRGRLTPCDQPPTCSRDDGKPNEDQYESEGWRMTHPLAELAPEEGEGCEVGDCRAEHGAEETESPGGGAGDRATGPAASSGGSEGPEVTCGLAADEADGHHQHAESKEDT